MNRSDAHERIKTEIHRDVLSTDALFSHQFTLDVSDPLPRSSKARSRFLELGRDFPLHFFRIKLFSQLQFLFSL